MAPLPADFGLRRGSKRRWGVLRPADLNFSIFFERVRLVAGAPGSPATRRASGVIGKKLKAAEWGNPRREILVEYSYGVGYGVLEKKIIHVLYSSTVLQGDFG